MNQTIEAIMSRRSIRCYKPHPIPSDIISTIIEAGNQAPSRGRMEEGQILFRPWRFVVVDDPEFRLKLVQTTLPIWKRATEGMKKVQPDMYENIMRQYEEMEEPKDMVYHCAPVILFVIGPADFAVSCALSCENIMVAATSLGLGSFYVGFGAMVTGNAEVVEALELVEGERIYGPIVLGYPDEESSALASIRPTKKEPEIKWI
ncbi:MAG: nitroreductase family protein [Candidatus Thorarchaeota archaeon]|nr:MAG: nitroreductase family protein [Candidatus Thorarchaeota archaeon]